MNKTSNFFAFIFLLQSIIVHPAAAQGGSGDDFVPWPWSKSEDVVTSQSQVLTKVDGIFLVREIKGASAEILKTNPLSLAIHTLVVHPTKGFYDTKIVPVYYPASNGVWPSDGYYDFVIYTRKRAGIVQPVLTEESVSEVFEIGSADSIKGIRIWSATNCVAVGVAGAFPKEKAQKCVTGLPDQ